MLYFTRLRYNETIKTTHRIKIGFRKDAVHCQIYCEKILNKSFWNENDDCLTLKSRDSGFFNRIFIMTSLIRLYNRQIRRLSHRLLTIC